MKVVGIIQARMGSTRLPKKVLADIGGQPMLRRVIDRLRRADRIDEIVVATSDQVSDEAIVSVCTDLGIALFRGSEHDVLDRYKRAAEAHDADVVVRITADCPLIDGELTNSVIEAFEARFPDVDYVVNSGYPRGLDTEVVSVGALTKAWFISQDSSSREHVTRFIYRHPEMFRLLDVTNSVDQSSMRWTVDEPADLEFIRTVYSYFGNAHFGWRDVLEVLVMHPEWHKINGHVVQKAV